MKDSVWREPGDPGLWRAIERVRRFAAETCPLRFPPGVYRHRSIEEAKQQRERWDEANFRAPLGAPGNGPGGARREESL